MDSVVSATEPNGEPLDSNNHPSAVYERLDEHDFVNDREFRAGLAAILRKTSPVTDEEAGRTDDLTMQAKCFYFSRKYGLNPYIDFQRYKAWKEGRGQGQDQGQATEDATGAATGITANEAGAGAGAGGEGESTAGTADTLATTATGNTVTAAHHVAATNAASTGGAIIEGHGTANPAGGPPNEPTYPSSFAHIVHLITTGQPIPGIETIPDTVIPEQASVSTVKQRRKPWEKEEPIQFQLSNNTNGVHADDKKDNDPHKEDEEHGDGGNASVGTDAGAGNGDGDGAGAAAATAAT